MHKESYPVTEFERDDWRLWHGLGLMRLIYDKAEAQPERGGGQTTAGVIAATPQLPFGRTQTRVTESTHALSPRITARQTPTYRNMLWKDDGAQIRDCCPWTSRYLLIYRCCICPPAPPALQVRIKRRKGSHCSCLKLCRPCLSFAELIHRRCRIRVLFHVPCVWRNPCQASGMTDTKEGACGSGLWIEFPDLAWLFFSFSFFFFYQIKCNKG